jgi:hypothetical protein
MRRSNREIATCETKAGVSNLIGAPMFLFERRAPSQRAFAAWREAAELVSARWTLFVEAEPEERRGAFASYIAALDAEEAAAARIKRLTLDRAA